MTALEKELKALREAIQGMGERPVRHYEFENLKLQVASLAEGLAELEQRIIELEQHKSLSSWVFRQAITIGVIAVIIYIFEVLK